MDGRVGQIDIASMKTRHDVLVEEMLKRGYRHESPYEMPDVSAYDLSKFTVDLSAALTDLLMRCPECKARFLDPKREHLWAGMIWNRETSKALGWRRLHAV